MPTEVVATQSVLDGGEYTFILKPGDYVLQAHYGPAVEGAAAPYREITLRPSDDIHADIPNTCI